MNRNHKIGLAFAVAAVAVPLILVSATFQGAAPRKDIGIDFSVYPETNPIVVERGKTTSIPLKVEAPNDAEMTLQIRLASGVGTADPGQFKAKLSEETLVLSKLDVTEGKVTELGSGSRGTRDAGTLTLNPPASMPPGNYTLGIEAERQINGESADALGSGTLIYITVK
ncbi:MAG: hypothetical protein ACREBU_17265 [Nitrososphaera sp.]